LRILALSGVATLLIGVLIGLLLTPWGFAAAAFGLADFAFIGLVRSGVVGSYRGGGAETGPAGAEAPELDPSSNPYARED